MDFARIALAAAMLAALAACNTAPREVPDAPPPPEIVPPPQKESVDVTPSVLHYRCDDRTDFSVRFADDTAQVDLGALGNDTLLRDAGGVTPQHTVYTSRRVRAEFGLGADHKEALMHYLAPAKEVRCSRD